MGPPANKIIQKDLPYLMAPCASTSKGAKVNSEIASNYVKEYIGIDPQLRYDFLEKIFIRNSEGLMDFLALLKASFRSDVVKGLFSLVYEIIINHNLEHEIKTKLFVQSLIFYDYETLSIDCTLL